MTAHGLYGQTSGLDRLFQMITDRPYVDLLVKSMGGSGPRLTVPPSFVIAASPENIQAVVRVLVSPPSPPTPRP